MKNIIYLVLLYIIFSHPLTVSAQSSEISGRVKKTRKTREALSYATVSAPAISTGVTTDDKGRFRISIPDQEQELVLIVSLLGYQPDTIRAKAHNNLEIALRPAMQVDEVVVTGTMRTVSRTESPIPVEVFSPKFFKKNPSPSLF